MEGTSAEIPNEQPTEPAADNDAAHNDIAVSEPNAPLTAPEISGGVRRTLRDLVDAIRGTEMDYTRGSIGRAILLLAVPMMLEMAMESVFAVIDVYFVASLGAGAVATVGLTESVLTLVYATAIGLSMGTTALVARRIGEKRKDQAAEIAGQAVIVSVLASLPVFFAGLFYAKDILALMGASAESIEASHGYTVWMLSGNVVIMLIFVINAVFRGAGDAATAMRVLWLANAINIVLDPMLIFGLGPIPALGIEGAAIATNIGRGTGVLLQFWVLFHGAKHIRVALAHLRPRLVAMGHLVWTSLGGIAQFFIATSSWIGLVRILSTFGDEALAGYTIALRIMVFTFLPAWGLSNAAATLVGQNLGANQPDRAERSVWITGWITMAFMAGVSVIYIVFNESLVRIFTDDPGVVSAAASCLRTVSYGYVAYAWGMVCVQAFNGAGDTVTPTIINLLCFWMFEIPFAYYLAIHQGIGEQGVYWSIIAAETSVSILAVALFTRGRWKLKRV